MNGSQLAVWGDHKHVGCGNVKASPRFIRLFGKNHGAQGSATLTLPDHFYLLLASTASEIVCRWMEKRRRCAHSLGYTLRNANIKGLAECMTTSGQTDLLTEK